MPAPPGPPLGLQLARVAKTVSAEFDAALAAAGGTLPTWLVLLALRTRQVDNQQQLADAIGIHGATLTHHLDALETRGLVTRRRDPGNRRNHLVALTEDGDALFHSLRAAAQDFDARLRRSITTEDVDRLAAVLDQLAHNASHRDDAQRSAEQSTSPG